MRDPKLKATPAGIMLSADARNKLQQVARWMKDELKGNQNPAIFLGYHGGIASTMKEDGKVYTTLSPLGVLVQMFKPFNLVDMKQLNWSSHLADRALVHARVAEILDISMNEFHRLVEYLYGTNGAWRFESIIILLRALK